jgi:hypothetical protein
VHAARERMTMSVLRCRHNQRFAMRNILRREENFFRQGALQASASLQSHNSKTLRPRTEYEACLSYAQSTIIF